jgi:hypothetical protein
MAPKKWLDLNHTTRLPKVVRGTVQTSLFKSYEAFVPVQPPPPNSDKLKQKDG